MVPRVENGTPPGGAELLQRGVGVRTARHIDMKFNIFFIWSTVGTGGAAGNVLETLCIEALFLFKSNTV